MPPYVTIYLWNTTTLHEFNIEASGGQEEYYIRSCWHSYIFRWPVPIRWADPPPPIDHRCVEIPLHQIRFTYSRMHIYQCPPPAIDHTCMEYHYTKEVWHISIYTYIKLPLLQLTIHLWIRTNQISVTYRRMHIFLWQMNPHPIGHRCMEYWYTKEVWHIAKCTYTKAPLLQLTIDVWNTTTPNKCNI